jgi:peptidoglycan/LPS O-acetylase OafA/YrhL
LDGLRGVLAVIVMAVHVAARLYPGPVLILSQIPVAIFFVLSGLVLTRAWDGRFGVFLGRRALRLWPVYALALAAGYLVAWRPPHWGEFFWIPWPNYDGDLIDGPVWSLFVEAWAAFFMPLIALAGRGGRLRALALGLVFVLAGRLFPPLLFGALFVLGAWLSRGTYRNAKLERPLPQWLGRISYSLYLTHWIVIAGFVRLFGPPGALLAILPALAIGHAVWWAVERPSITLSRRVGATAATRWRQA